MIEGTPRSNDRTRPTLSKALRNDESLPTRVTSWKKLAKKELGKGLVAAIRDVWGQKLSSENKGKIDTLFNLLNPWDVLLRHGDWRCVTEDVLLRPGLAWLQWSRTSFRCARLNTDVNPRTRDESLRLSKKKNCPLHLGSWSFECVRFQWFSAFTLLHEGCLATRQLRLEDVVQTYSSDNGSDIEHFLDDKRDLWPGFSTKLVLKSTVRRRTRWRSLRYAQCCPHRRRNAERDESDNEDVYQVSWEAGFRSWWQKLLPWRPSEGKERRNFVGELVGATCTTSCLLTHHSQCQCACNIERLPRLSFFAFSGYLEWQRPFRANQGKKELVERNSVDLALRVRGCAKEFKGRLKNDCNTDESLSFFQFPCYSFFFELSLMLHDLYFSLSVFFYSFWTHLQPSGRWKNLTCLVSSTKLDVNATTWDCSDGL